MSKHLLVMSLKGGDPESLVSALNQVCAEVAELLIQCRYDGAPEHDFGVVYLGYDETESKVDEVLVELRRRMLGSWESSLGSDIENADAGAVGHDQAQPDAGGAAEDAAAEPGRDPAGDPVDDVRGQVADRDGAAPAEGGGT